MTVGLSECDYTPEVSDYDDGDDYEDCLSTNRPRNASVFVQYSLHSRTQRQFYCVSVHGVFYCVSI
jgi:hypothetical protein